MNETNLKTFILYCQSVETLYTEWKNYWLKVLTTDNKETSSFIPHDTTSFDWDKWSKEFWHK